MAGYQNYSMSNNAVRAYSDGLAPLSKIGAGKYIRAAAEFLGPEEWHHTSKKYNRTDFYSVRAVRGLAAQMRAAGGVEKALSEIAAKRAGRRAASRHSTAHLLCEFLRFRREAQTCHPSRRAEWESVAASALATYHRARGAAQ